MQDLSADGKQTLRCTMNGPYRPFSDLALMTALQICKHNQGVFASIGLMGKEVYFANVSMSLVTSQMGHSPERHPASVMAEITSSDKPGLE